MVSKGEAISQEKKAYARFLLEQKKMSCRKVARTVGGISKSFVGQMKTPSTKGKRRRSGNRKRGRPSKLSPRDKRRILRCLKQLRKTEGFFTSDRLMEASLQIVSWKHPALVKTRSQDVLFGSFSILWATIS